MIIVRYLSPLLFCVLLSGCLVSQQDLDRQIAENQRLKRQSNQLRSERDDLRSQLAEAEADNSQLRMDLGTFKDQLDQQQKRMQQELESLQFELEDKNEQLDQLYQRSDSLQANTVELQQQLEKEKIARAARIASLKTTYDELVGALENEVERERKAKRDAAAQLRKTYNELTDSLQKEIAQGEIVISEQEGRLTINMVAKVLFDSGKAQVKKGGLAILKKVGRALKKVENKRIQVEGHTDSIPISGPLKETFFSNWELSTARATAVVRYLQDSSRISGRRLAATGYSSYHPVANNDSAEGRAKNRRIQIVLAPMKMTTP